MATLTVRNIPDEAKHRFRRVAAAHGRSMEEHLRRLVIEADLSETEAPTRVADAPQAFTPEPTKTEWLRHLVGIADGAGDGVLDPRKYAEIRYMTAKDAMAALRRLANGVGLDLPGRMNTALDAPEL